MTTKVAVIVGSLRKDSVNRLAQALAKFARPKLDLQLSPRNARDMQANVR